MSPLSRTRRALASSSKRGAPLLAAGFAVIVLMSLSPFGRPQQAEANGVPTLVSLRYLEGLSNWGPTDATGELELSFAEGFARLKAQGLEQLAAERYQGWLVNSETNDAISIGRFNATADGTLAYEGTLPPIADFGFDLFIVTVEPEPDDAPQPHSQRSIGGYFDMVGPSGADGLTPSDVSMQPTELPNTGAPALLSDIGRISLLLAAMALSIFVSLRLGRRSA